MKSDASAIGYETLSNTSKILFWNLIFYWHEMWYLNKNFKNIHNTIEIYFFAVTALHISGNIDKIFRVLLNIIYKIYTCDLKHWKIHLCFLDLKQQKIHIQQLSIFVSPALEFFYESL